MKKQIKKIGLLFISTIAFIGCSKDDEPKTDSISPPSSQEFKALRDAAMNDITQNFTLGAGDNSVQFTSEKGVKFTVNRSCLSLN